MASRDYCGIARQYAADVLGGKIPACKWVKLAADRQLADLKTYAGSRSPYVFDENEANRVCKFIELLTHTKGELAGTRIHLEPWQVFILTTVFGWLRRADGGRRYRRAYVEVSRGNGKSTLCSGIGLYCLLADREGGAEVYSFATTRDQAKIVFGDAKVMAERNAALRQKFGLQVLANALYVPQTNSTFQAKSAEGSTLDGLNTHLAIIDELHAHKTRAVYDVVETSTGKRKNSLMFVITTAGFDTSGICYEVRTMVTKVLEKSVVDETQFGIIYGLDEGDDWTTVEALEKANPNWGISVRPEIITSLMKKAIALPSAVNNFKTKHLNIWCSASSAWMDMQAWEAGEINVDRSDFEGQPCYIGLDVGAKNDVTAKVLLFPVGKSFVVFADFYLPEAAVEKSTNSQYRGWVEEGWITQSGGAMTDLARIEEDIRDDLSRFDVKGIAYDPWNALQLATNLGNDGAPMVEYRNTVQNFSDPMKSLEALVQDKRVNHDGNPVLRWMMGNVVAKLDAKDNIFPRKERYENKIDGVVALIMALGISNTSEEANPFDDIEESSESVFIEW
jgi:phage terminase large subunit-like protein